MRTWGEFVSFLRGTRTPPAPKRGRPLVTVLFVAAALLHLPLVYLLVKGLDLQPAFTLSIGLLSIGLAWGGGVALEGRRGGTVRILGAMGLGEGALAFVPVLAETLGDARWLFVGIAVLSLLGLAMHVRE